jgi:uncharacterized protein YciI
MATIANFVETSGEAPFVLQCTVKKINASNVVTVKSDHTTAIARVDEVFSAPSVLGNLKGKLITVRFTKGGAKVGQRLIVKARPWQYSSSIAIVEIERLTSKVQKDLFRQQVLDAHLSFLDQQLERRISSAKLIVSGKVLDVEKVKSKEIYKLEDEQEDWYEATILVSSLEKGTLGKTPEVRVRFPGNESEKWYIAPKFHVGQEGIWLLHEGSTRSKAKSRTTESYLTALDPLDFHLLNQLHRIRTLIGRTK